MFFPQERCNNLNIRVEKTTLLVDVCVLESEEFNLVFGIKWLETLGETKTDWTKRTMSFTQDGCTVNDMGFVLSSKNNV